MATKINENTELSMPIRNLMAMVVGAAIGTWGLFWNHCNDLNTIENKFILVETDLGQNTEFRYLSGLEAIWAVCPRIVSSIC